MSRKDTVEDREFRSVLSNAIDSTLSPRIARLAVPVFWPDEYGRPELVGTCHLLRIGADTFLLTAGHLLDLDNERPLAIVVQNKVCGIEGEATRISPTRQRRSDGGDFIDIGVVRLAPHLASNLNESELLGLHDVELVRVRAESAAHVVIGFPCSRNRKSLNGEHFGARTYEILTFEVSEADYTALRRDPDEQLAVVFDRKDVWRVDGRVTAPNLHGMSGGAMWRLDAAGTGHAALQSAQLAAIPVEWHDKGKLKHILGTRIRPVVALLARKYPSVRDAIREYVAARQGSKAGL